MSIVNKINVSGTEYDIRDNRVRFEDGADFDYGTLVQGGINNTNGYTTGTVLRRSETYWPVIEGPANIVMSNGLTGYIRLYDANKTMLDPDSTLPGADTTNHRLVIGNSATLTVTMKEYNPSAVYFRFYFSCGTEDNISALVRENARIVPLQTVATSGEMQTLSDDVSDLKSAIDDLYSSAPNADVWSQGTISASTGTNAASNTRIRTSRLGTTFLGFTLDDGYAALIYAYDGETYVGNWNGTSFVKTTTGNVWFEGTIVFAQINIAYEYRIAVKKKTDENISVNDNTHVLFIAFTDKTLSVPGKAADAEITGKYINRIPHYMAYTNNTTDLVWVNAAAGEMVLVKTADGSTFAGENLNIYDNTGEYKNYVALTANYGSFRTFVISSDWGYVKPTVEQNLVIINLSKLDPISNNLVVSNVIKVKDEVDRKSAQSNSDFDFVYFSDIHNSEANGNRIFEYAKMIGADCIVNGGDTVLTVIADDITWYNTLVTDSGIDTLTCVGNHDAWTNQSTGALASQTDIYSKFIAPMVSAVSDIIQPTGASSNGLCYYYKDYGTIRVIVLQAMTSIGWNSEQGTWLQSVLADANEHSKYVICVNHAPYQKAYTEIDMDIPLNSFIDYRTGNFDNIHLAQDAVAAVDAFKQAGGKFVCWLSGHTHGDFIMHNSAYAGQLMISIATAKYSRHFDGFCPKETETWSDNFDCFDQIGIDTTHNIIKVLRIGYHEDAGMRIRNRFAYDFVNNKLISYS